jgi:hypothetical protein
MLKRVLYAGILILALTGISQTDVFSNATTCPDYEIEQYIGTTLYIFTYNCDGVLVGIREAED